MAKFHVGMLAVLGVLAGSCRHNDTSAGVKDSAPSAEDQGTATPEAQASDVAAGIGDIFRYNYGPRNQGKPVPAVRAAFRRTLGCAKAKVELVEGLEPTWQQGILASQKTGKTSYDAWIRFSMDRTAPTGEDDFDKSSLAFSLKILPGAAEAQPPTAPLAKEQDIITQNHPVFFADTASEFLLAFLNPKLLNKDTLASLEKQFGADLTKGISPTAQARMDSILNAMEKPVGNALRKTFWSVTPYRFGPDSYAKYRIVPVLCQKRAPSTVVDAKRATKTLPGTLAPVFDDTYGDEPLPSPTNKTYLAERLQRDLQQSGACYEWQVQRHDGKDESQTETPLDKATVAWDETRFVPRTVARITIPRQDPSANLQACQMAVFSPGHAWEEHAPVGSINKARVQIYQRFSQCRREQNSGQASAGFKQQCLPN